MRDTQNAPHPPIQGTPAAGCRGRVLALLVIFYEKQKK